MSHVAAHRLADLDAGLLSDAEAASVQRHVDRCSTCREALLRIVAGRAAMASIKEESAPELGWDHIGARIYWSTSSEQRARGRNRRSPWMLPVLGGVSAAAIVAVGMWATSGDERPESAAIPSRRVPAPPVVASKSRRAPERLSGMVTFSQGEVQADGEALVFDSTVGVGKSFSTGQGRLVVQFGEHSAFRVGAHSQLELRRFDSERIELRVVGMVDVDITRRLPGQDFVVVAGEHEVVVRGTAFRVEFREGELGVSCTRGKVVVTDGDDEVNVPAGQVFRVLSEAWNEAALRAAPLDSKALGSLSQSMHMPMLPVWKPEHPLSDHTAVIEVSAAPGQAVAVDGVAVSEGDFMLRAMSGRHQISLVDGDGVVADGEWVSAAAGERASARVSLTPEPGRIGAKSRRLRKQQLLRAVDAAGRATRCLAPLAKQGLMQGSYLLFEVGINPDGSQRYLNVVDSNLSPFIQRCLRRAVDAELLPAGPATDFQFRLSF